MEEITMFEKFADLLVDELQIDRDDITMEAELSKATGCSKEHTPWSQHAWLSTLQV